MPRIDPMKLLVCLSVLLAPNGGIRNAGEVRRLANLMAKFSKKLVSKAIYIQILKCTETELLGQFMHTGGWSLVHTWLADGIGTKNWPLIQELMELLLCCPVDVERLKINSTPRLVKSLSTDCAHESVKVLATKLVEQWLYIVKAPKQSSPMVPLTQSELPSITGLPVDGKQYHAEGIQNASKQQQHVVEPVNGMVGNHNSQHNGYGDQHTVNNGEVEEMENPTETRDSVDTGKKTFQAAVGGDVQQTAKKTSLVLKITTKNGKQVVAKVIKSSRNIERDVPGTNKLTGYFHGEDNAEGEEEDDGEGEDQEEVLVNIESGKSSDEPTFAVRAGKDEPIVSDTKKSVDVQNGIDTSSSSNKERNTSSSSSKEKDRHHHSHRDHRDREKDRKGSSSRSSSSKSSGSSSSSSKHKSSSSSSSSRSVSSSSSRSKDKDRHGSSSSSSSKHKSSSSSTSKSNGNSSSSKSSSSSDKHRDSKDRSSHSTSGGSSSGSSRDSKNQSQSLSPPKLSRKDSREDAAGGGSNDSGSETSTTNTSASNCTKSSKSAIIPSKKASISIEVRNPENRPKTVKTYNSQFRSHGLIEEAPPPPSRKGLKKPSSSTSPAATSSANTSSTTAIGSTAIGTLKRSSPTPISGRDATLAAGAPSAEKKPKEDPVERPGSIKLIPPKRQHALVESDMFMDALSATLRKDVKKRKRRTSGSESSNTSTTTVVASSSSSKPGEVTAGSKPSADTGTTAKTPGSPTKADDSATEVNTPTTPTSPKVPTIAPMSFYRDTLAEQEEENGAEPVSTDEVKNEDDKIESNDAEGKKIKTEETEEDDDEEPIVKKPKRVKCELNEDDEDENGSPTSTEKKTTTLKKKESSEAGDADEKTELIDAVMSEVEKKIAEEAEGEKKDGSVEKDDETPVDGKKPPGPGCGPDGPPGVLVIHRRKGPKKQLRWRVAEELEEVRYFELDVTERCNVTKSFTDMKQMERVDERQKFMLSRKVGSEDVMVERTAWRPLLVVDNVPPSPDGSQSLERNIQRQRERGCLQALYFNKHMIPDSPSEPDPADMYQTADPVHIPLEDVTGNPDSVNDFTSVPWPDPRSTPPHESGGFNSPFFPSDLPPAAGFGPGGFPPPFAPSAAATIGPGPWNMGPPGGAAGVVRSGGGVLPPGMFPLNQPPPGMGGGGSPNMLNLPMSMQPNVPPPGMFPGAAGNFNAPPPELSLMAGGGGPDMGGRRGPGQGGVDFRNGPPPQQQQWVTGNRSFGGGNNPSRGGNAGGGGFGNRGGGGGGNWNNRNNNGGNNGNRNGGGGDRGRMGDDGRGNFRGHWLQNNRGHNRGGGGRKW
ncbi:serine/threonine-protein phosphatase 1 regulatory subunit 10 [Anopheles maculipalpis]|uniref:serine/threonine-protein phosphatase 1 regulatory subunit 10 n=1 Tax=Anopheles maculipalpis TaxID=1496333 RepID=UPI0021591C99|nr:serine/threonine-protein phosphatase 1 regulatory subunit 10 [Anopheles maculipalpis]